MAHPRAGKPGEAAPVKYLAAILYGRGYDLGLHCFPELEALLGPIDYRGKPHPFTTTDYYADEMGAHLERLIVSFEELLPPTDLVRVKLATYEIEKRLEADGGRTVNIDSGYIDYFKVVLASFKEGPQKIYMGEGVFADPVLLYQDGSFQILPWTFPDLKEGFYMEDFFAIRKRYKQMRRGDAF
jgi:hypothetical protein